MNTNTTSLQELSGYTFHKDNDKVHLAQLGTIYRAIHKSTQKPCLLKFVPDNHLLTPDLILSELPLLQALNHPNLVKYYDVFVQYNQDKQLSEWEENYVYVLENQDFISLAEFPTQTFWEAGLKIVISHVLEALRYLHNQNIVHGHLQPSQILLTDNKAEIRAKLFYSSQAMRLSSEFWQPYEYQAPEQLLNKANQISNRTDIWAFGVILYEMLTQELPYGSEKQGFSAQDIIQHIAQHPTPALLHTILQPYRYIIGKCLQIKPKERFNNVNEIIYLLNNPEFVQDLPSTNTPLKSFKGITKNIEPPLPQVEKVPEKKIKTNDSNLWLVVFSLLILLCVSSAITFLIDNGKTFTAIWKFIENFWARVRL
ncbi:MAG: serine/threonine protein kinase [Microscillaceae bacterium]|nr:serine/threonine protein kinase [Microscillaceae bacterium]MDW8460500.1 serine/threonine-protein kinase [Cytophagales bacterium]